MSKIKTFLLCVAIPLFVGGISWYLSRGGMAIFQQLQKPPLSPPGFIFPIVWTILYILMGIASFLVLNSGGNPDEIQNAIFVYGIQLAVNFFWSILFFRCEWYFFSFLWLILLWVMILITITLFYRLSKPAAYLMVPYLLWVTFAGYLNFSISLLNK